MKPLGRRVLVRRDEIATKVGSIHIPDKAQRKPLGGTVVAVGPEVTTVHPGDRILFGEWSTRPVGEDGEMLYESEIMAVLE